MGVSAPKIEQVFACCPCQCCNTHTHTQSVEGGNSVHGWLWLTSLLQEGSKWSYACTRSNHNDRGLPTREAEVWVVANEDGAAASHAQSVLEEG